jgi:hypothetical protein
VPRHPACTAPTTRRLVSANRIGTQSAVWIPRSKPAWPDNAASPRGASSGASENMCTTSEWIWRRVISDCSAWMFAPNFERGVASVTARTNAVRLRLTASGVSQSVKPRLRAAIELSRLAPAFRVLKACTTHGTESKILAVSISRPAMLWRAQPSSMILVAGAFRGCRRVVRALGIIVISTASLCLCGW